MALGDKLPVVMGREKAAANGVATLGADGKLAEAQRPTTDATPAQGSANPVQSGGVYTALAGKADTTLSNLSNRQRALENLGAGVRPKLNDNPFFLVNQRGQSSYTVNGYTVDRWKMGTNAATLDILSDGVKITLNQAPSNDMRLLHQIIEDPQRLIGKTIIAAFYVTAVTGTGFRCGFRANSGTISSQYANITQPGLYTALFTVPSGCTELLLTTLASAGTPSGQSMTILAATAEIGNTQTLAYQDEDGAWQLLPQPESDYATQLARCQRYYQIYSTADARPSKAVDCRPVMRTDPAQGTIVVVDTTYYYNTAEL